MSQRFLRIERKRRFGSPGRKASDGDSKDQSRALFTDILHSTFTDAGLKDLFGCGKNPQHSIDL